MARAHPLSGPGLLAQEKTASKWGGAPLGMAPSILYAYSSALAKGRSSALPSAPWQAAAAGTRPLGPMQEMQVMHGDARRCTEVQAKPVVTWLAHTRNDMRNGFLLPSAQGEHSR